MKLETRVETIENVLEAEELIGTLTYYVDKFGAHGEVYVHSSTRYAYGEEEPELTIVYKFVSEEETKYARFGGKEGDPGINMGDLGIFDPSGGLFISEGFVIDGKRVKRIFADDGDVFFEVD